MINEKRILNEFLEMVQIDSLSYKEADFAKVLIEKLEEIGCTVYVDDAGKNTGGETGNIIATLKGNKDYLALIWTL